MSRPITSTWTPSWVFCWSAFKGHIEAEIVKNLDDLLAPKPARKAAAKAAPKK